MITGAERVIGRQTPAAIFVEAGHHSETDLLACLLIHGCRPPLARMDEFGVVLPRGLGVVLLEVPRLIAGILVFLHMLDRAPPHADTLLDEMGDPDHLVKPRGAQGHRIMKAVPVILHGADPFPNGHGTLRPFIKTPGFREVKGRLFLITMSDTVRPQDNHPCERMGLVQRQYLGLGVRFGECRGSATWMVH